MVMEQCHLPSWRVFVVKQFVELLPPLLVAMRPPQVSSKAVRRVPVRLLSLLKRL
jgi:hypothetical protein